MYNDLYRAWKSEITSQDPQPLPNDFYQKTQAYLGGLDNENASIDEHTVKGRISLKEKEVVSRLLHELKETRLRKLVALAREGQTINDAHLTQEESKFLSDFKQSLQTLNQTEAQTKTAAAEEKVDLCIVRFLQDIPEIVGTDLRIYGPYKKEDVGSLPDQNAKALVRQGAAKEIEVSGILRTKKKEEINAINNK